MNLSKIIIVFCVVVPLAGCTTAGPYVTNISSDGANGLTIEKCKVELNAFLGVINTGNCLNSTLKLTNSSGGHSASQAPYQEKAPVINKNTEPLNGQWGD